MPDLNLHHGDCLDYLPTMEENSVDAVVTDPPYGLSFMGKDWDHGVPSERFWTEILRVCKPGAMLLAFGGTRTHHRLMVAIEDAGWEIRDCLMWLYGSGFPKSLSIGKALDKTAGAEREVVGTQKLTGSARFKGRMCHTKAAILGGPDIHIDSIDITTPATPEAAAWEGFGTGLKPAWEPIILAMKPLDGTFANNALTWGVAGLNVDASRIDSGGTHGSARSVGLGAGYDAHNTPGRIYGNGLGGIIGSPHQKGRWPANLLLTHHPDCVRVGTKRVRGAGAFPKQHGRSWAVTSEERPERIEMTDPDGKETVEAWECVEGCPVRLLDEQSGISTSSGGQASLGAFRNGAIFGKGKDIREKRNPGLGDTGGASRFFAQLNFGPDDEEALRFCYCAKASRAERNAGLEGMEEQAITTQDKWATNDRRSGTARQPTEWASKPVANNHPTVKPLALMRYLITLVTRPEHTVLDPFMGSSSTGRAAVKLGRGFIGIEKEQEAFEIAKQRIADAQRQPQLIGLQPEQVGL